MRRAPAPPLWFLLCVVVVVALVLRRLLGAVGGETLGGGDGLQVQLAFWGWLASLGSLIFKGLQIAGKAALAALQWSVKALWLFATKTANALTALGRGVVLGLKKAWEFFRLTYEKVLKPAWLKFWRWFDKFRLWLDRTFRPIFDFLRDVRDHIMGFYKTWIRPWLDLIGVTRKVLGVLAGLGLDWARALDRRLAGIEAAIDRPFRIVLAELNKVVNIVNRIATLDGLLQRLTLVRSVVRDAGLIINSLANARSKPLTSAERDDMRKRLKGRPLSEIVAEKRVYFTTGGGPSQPVIDEMVLIARRHLES